MRIGFIGLGAMGRPMASNLVAAGFDVAVWNRAPEPVQRLVDAGATPAEPAACAGADVLVTMLTDGDALEEVLDQYGLVEAMGPGTIHVNMATVSLPAARQLAERHHQAGAAYIAAPVLGRPDMAKAAKLNILAAGPETELETVRPVLETLGARLWPLGESPEQANLVKLAANFMLVSAVEAMGEASSLVAAHGMEPSDFLEVVTGSVFNAPAYGAYAPAMADRSYDNPEGFRLALGAKDLELGLQAAREGGVPLPVAGAVRERMTQALSAGHGDQDLSVLAETARESAHLDDEKAD